MKNSGRARPFSSAAPSLPVDPSQDVVNGTKESLSKRFSRAKARWLRRVMYSGAIPIEKAFAYVVADHVNCVTEDAWPSQDTISGTLELFDEDHSTCSLWSPETATADSPTC